MIILAILCYSTVAMYVLTQLMRGHMRMPNRFSGFCWYLLVSIGWLPMLLWALGALIVNSDELAEGG